MCVRRNQSDLLILWQIFLTIVDLSGNTGLAASYLTARYRPRTLLTVEPIPQSRAVLHRNAELSGLDWLVDPRAVSGTPGTLDFAVSGFWDTCTAVPAVSELRRSRPYRLDLLKVDVEGSEAEIFAEPRPWLDRVDRIVLEIHDKYIDGGRVRATLRGAGFRRIPPRVPDPVGFNPVELHVRV